MKHCPSCQQVLESSDTYVPRSHLPDPVAQAELDREATPHKESGNNPLGQFIDELAAGAERPEKDVPFRIDAAYADGSVVKNIISAPTASRALAIAELHSRFGNPHTLTIHRRDAIA